MPQISFKFILTYQPYYANQNSQCLHILQPSWLSCLVISKSIREMQLETRAPSISFREPNSTSQPTSQSSSFWAGFLYVPHGFVVSCRLKVPLQLR